MKGNTVKREKWPQHFDPRGELRGRQMKILHQVDVSTYSEEMKQGFKTHFLPILRKLVPDGDTLEGVFLENPPTFEIRKPFA